MWAYNMRNNISYGSINLYEISFYKGNLSYKNEAATK